MLREGGGGCVGGDVCGGGEESWGAQCGDAHDVWQEKTKIKINDLQSDLYKVTELSRSNQKRNTLQ